MRNKKIPVWLPYTSSIECKQNKVRFEYKGGTCDVELLRTTSILFYGAVCDLSEKFLMLCARNRVPLCIHRRNAENAIWILPTAGGGEEDIVTRQILTRTNEKKRKHIAYKLLAAKFESMSWLVAPPMDFSARIESVDGMRSMEARHARRYWEKYYQILGYRGHTRRGARNLLKSVLDAVSKLISGVMLRYVIYHRLSPYHAFLHVPTSYPALLYDLMEPYRGYVEKVVFNTFSQRKGDEDEKALLGMCIKEVEGYLDESIYCSSTRQIVTFQELLHGNVLALRAYLLRESTQFIVPCPGKPNGGRPVKTGYRLYGRSAGPTDFWSVAEEVHARHEATMKNALTPTP